MSQIICEEPSDDRGDPEQLLNEKQTAAILGLTDRAIQNWRVRGGGPDFIKVGGRTVRYRRQDILDWIEARRVNSTSEYGRRS